MRLLIWILLTSLAVIALGFLWPERFGYLAASSVVVLFLVTILLGVLQILDALTPRR